MLKLTPKTPTPYSYWVKPGQLLAGAHPATSIYEENALRTLRPVLEAGATVFIDLTETEEEVYKELLQKEAVRLGVSLTYHHLPVVDMDIPTPIEMIRILDTIDAAIEAGRTVYVHCFAGLGRTGTVVGCYLARHGISGSKALKQIRWLRREMPFDTIKSPATKEQRDMVRNWPIGR